MVRRALLSKAAHTASELRFFVASMATQRLDPAWTSMHAASTSHKKERFSIHHAPGPSPCAAASPVEPLPPSQACFPPN